MELRASSSIVIIVAFCLIVCQAEKQKECCSSILLEADNVVHGIQGERLGFYKQLGTYGERPAYR